MKKITLYNYYRSSTSYRVRAALHYKNLDFEYKAVHLLKDGGEQHQSEYKKMNPMAEVPTLVCGDFVLSQSLVILQYLDDEFPGKNLFPRESQKRAQVLQFCENINSFMHPLCNLKVLQYLESLHQYGPQEKQSWISHWVQRGFEATELFLEKVQSLGGTQGKYCFGNELTAADFLLVPQVFSAQRFNVDLKPYKKIMRVNESCLGLECFIKAHPYRQVDTPDSEKID